jgi:hypothetical protein
VKVQYAILVADKVRGGADNVSLNDVSNILVEEAHSGGFPLLRAGDARSWGPGLKEYLF